MTHLIFAVTLNFCTNGFACMHTNRKPFFNPFHSSIAIHSCTEQLWPLLPSAACQHGETFSLEYLLASLYVAMAARLNQTQDEKNVRGINTDATGKF